MKPGTRVRVVAGNDPGFFLVGQEGEIIEGPDYVKAPPDTVRVKFGPEARRFFATVSADPHPKYDIPVEQLEVVEPTETSNTTFSVADETNDAECICGATATRVVTGSRGRDNLSMSVCGADSCLQTAQNCLREHLS